MKALILSVLTLTVVGCSAMRQGTAFDGTICSMATDLEARQRMAAVIAVLPDGEDKQKAQAAMALAGLSADALCLQARALEGTMK